MKFRNGVPPPPPWLSESARKEYRRVCREMKLAGIAPQHVDLAVLTRYAHAASAFAHLAERIDVEGWTVPAADGSTKQNPL